MVGEGVATEMNRKTADGGRNSIGADRLSTRRKRLHQTQRRNVSVEEALVSASGHLKYLAETLEVPRAKVTADSLISFAHYK